MRPIKLTLSGFESYVKETVIDFTKFGKSDLFLISGKTGSGKTSVFDAIKYALYGEASGDERGEKGLISRTVADKLYKGDTADLGKGYRPFVELEFEVCGRKYTIIRKPAYDIEGRTSKGSEAELTSEDGSVTETKIRAVEVEVERLVGLDAKQFSSVAMIAQGEFSEIVVADKNNRAELLKKIFGITKFQRFKDLLFDEKKRIFGLSCASRTGIETLMKGIKISVGNPFGNELKRAIASEDRYNLVPECLLRYIDRDKKALEEKEAEIAEIKIKLEAITKKKDLLESKKGYEKTAADCIAEINRLTEILKKAEAEKAELEKRSEEIKKLQERKAVITSLLPKYAELSNAEKDIGELSKEITNRTLYCESTEKQVSCMKKRLEEIEKQLETLKDVSADIEKAKNESEKLAAEQENINRISRTLADMNTAKKRLELLRTAADSDIKSFEDAQNKLAKLQSAFLREQAGLLASDLQENEPCPVCGSIHHPKKAVLSENAVTEADVNYAKANADKLSKIAEKSTSEATSAGAALSEKNKAFEEEFSRLFPETSVNDAENTIKVRLSEIYAKVNELNVLISKLNFQTAERKKLESEKAEIDKKLPELSRMLSDYTAEKASLSASLDEKKKQLEKDRKELEFKSEAEAKALIVTVEKQVNAYNESVENNRKALSEAEKSISEQKGKLASAKSELEKLPELDSDAIEKEFSELDGKLKVLEIAVKDLYAELTSNEDTYNRLLSEIENYTKLNEECGAVDIMYTVAKGSARNPSFENYILSYYFRKIVNQANERLYKITDSQYRLSLPEEGNLTLYIHDDYNGTVREASSLSGGEKFKAALALAFGFADVMGGRNRLESLFIDEGFGSLSDDSLKSVLQLLIEQSGGNKLIGIISHVDDMKNSIGNKILVEKDHSGCSSVKIHVGE